MVLVVVQAGHVASLGGVGNIVTRAAGGMLSDYCNWRFGGMKARLAVQVRRRHHLPPTNYATTASGAGGTHHPPAS